MYCMTQALELVLAETEKCLRNRKRILIALEGRCGAGKTTFAKALQERLEDAIVLHMDDFFLRPEQRTEERLRTPGENVDHERFLEEVLRPCRYGKSFQYQPYDCHVQQLKAPIEISPKQVCIVEGAYACHPELTEYYDLRIFMDVEPSEQLRRIGIRNGQKEIQRFRELWIPLEERYFKAHQVKERCDIVLQI